MSCSPRPPFPIACLVALALALACALPGCGDQPPKGNLLAGLGPSRFEGVDSVLRLTDGVLAYEGDAWDSDQAARFTSPDGFVEYDLGAVHALRCALLEGDDNDDYQLFGSIDGARWTQIFDAGPVSGAGLRTRASKLEAAARYLKLSATGGDRAYSVAELAVYETCPAPWPPNVLRAHSSSPFDVATRSLYLFAAALLAFLIVHRAGNRLINVSILIPLAALAWMAHALYVVAPLFNLETPIRGLIAALALAVLVRECVSPRWHPADPRWMKGVLALLSIGALGCYYHFGSLQFRDEAKQRQTLVHGFDMRHYFPLAKYFRELHFDGLYDASLAAYVDMNPGMTLDRVGNVKLRDLQTADVREARDLTAQIDAVRARFTPARWAEFTQDMRYFAQSMGANGYLGTMRDHGGNATPVWILGAYLLFAHAPANELVLTLAGLIDPLLILFLIIAIYRSFGARVALYTVILFGATDFYQFGTNMFGSTLRQDWLVAAGLGACAIRTRRPMLGGFLLAYAGLIRAFPAIAVMVLPVPILWALFDRWMAKREIKTRFNLREFLTSQSIPVRAIAGALLSLALLVGTSSALFGWQHSWGDWFKKIAIHATGPSINNVGLRAAIMFEPEHISERVIRNDLPEPWEDWQRYQTSAFARRRPLFLFINAAMLLLVLLAARRRPLEQVAMLGLLLIPFLFYPSNYYCHYIFLLPLAAAFNAGSTDDPRDRLFAWGVASLLILCIAQWLTMDIGWSDVRYAAQSFELLIASLSFVLPMAWRGLMKTELPWLASRPSR